MKQGIFPISGYVSSFSLAISVLDLAMHSCLMSSWLTNKLSHECFPSPLWPGGSKCEESPLAETLLPDNWPSYHASVNHNQVLASKWALQDSHCRDQRNKCERQTIRVFSFLFYQWRWFRIDYSKIVWSSDKYLVPTGQLRNHFILDSWKATESATA